jgi:Kae1-associated kinase Bud32
MIKGAEATIEIEDDLVIKKREVKNYRHSDLDSKIREERTDTEVRLIKDAKRHNVKAPEAEKIDDSTIEMDKIEGKILKETLADNLDIMKNYGRNIGHLHSTEIIHGDLTTSNAMVSEDKLYVIDFGLAFRSQRIEDKAVDIHLLKQVLNSSHPEIAEEAWKDFVEGYSKYERSEEVFEQLKDVEKRGRYK